MVSVEGLEERLRENYDAVLKILLELGFDEDRIRYKESQHLITSPRPEEDADNPNGCLIYLDSLCVIYTTRAWSGNIFSLVMKIREVSFPEALRLIAGWIGYEDSLNVKIKFPWGGFWKNVVKNTPDLTANIPSHKESELPDADSLSCKYIQDGVSALIQEEWGVRYSHEDDAILTPIYDYSGNLVGCKARNNDPECDDSNRFWAYIPYPKTLVVYGWFQNFSRIAEKHKVLVVESEKGVLQAASFGCEVAVAIGGHNISATQAKYIKMLGAKTIIIGFDEGISEEEIQEECKKLRSDGYMKNKVKYIYDKEHLVLPKGSKGSPVDYGKEGLRKLLKNCCWNYGGKNGEKG